MQDAIGFEARFRQRDNKHGQEAEQVGRGAGQAGAHQPQPRQAEMPEDQGIVACGIEQDGKQHHDHGRHRAGDRGGETSQHHEAHGEGQAESQRTDKARRIFRQ